jgi:hypothetical protein
MILRNLKQQGRNVKRFRAEVSQCFFLDLILALV